MALGINQIAGDLRVSSSGCCSAACWPPWDWRLVFWVNVPIGAVRHGAGRYRSLREIAHHQAARRIDWIGNVTFAVGLGALLVAITYGIQPYGGHPTGWTNPWCSAAWSAGSSVLGRVLRRRDEDRRADVPA